ncbi:transcription factor A, mitochondrial [Odontomachus brunneus]|uniref:transcription factor A, mitochondrial n=1 Tax=Odontomachus brunneus TaxID=486640 RepID=UPI0013F20A60|nr:transcription factor A, mitochondrial [Odontomachus brunneus]XP_032675160.1 transcription factor A, mitochondrial [Odontomachus brunneus]
MATWRLLFPNSPVNLLCTRKLASMKSTTMKMMNNIGKDILPPKPKKPPNPYLLYLHSVRNKLQQEHPDIKYKELIKKISEEWAKVDSTIKQEFQKQHDDEYVLYKQKLDDYNNLVLSEEQKMLLAKQLMKDSTFKKNHEFREEILKKFGKPKRPLTSYNIFLQSKKYNKDSKIPHKEWMKNISNEWNNMTIQDKDKYHTMSKQLKDKYNIELTKWKENMIKTGHVDLIKSNIESKRDSSISKYEK